MATATMHHEHSSSSTRFEARQYLPLAAAVLISMVATYTLELLRAVDGFVFVHEAMNAFMGFFFVVFAVPKLFDIKSFAMSFAEYDVIGMRSSLYAKAYPVIELALGVVLLSNLPTHSVIGNQLISVIIMMLTGIGIYGVARTLRRGEKHYCACLGSFFKFPLSKVSIFENGLMFMMAMVMLLFYGSLHTTVISLFHMRMIH